ncbi:hypothetical protein HPP92_015890 [Vanilla planifolia]|uniref:Polyphenol oxidase C-terminal domain-containing protein n=1 Tax=Vanilla planifolia TaxID=51239 RepID=A0A835P879_VANPL|nr:hypothetical protein HPP92_027634 [Vanilla planifolia]KAG0471344.1 hypothetical protein HPP92_015890 [Vanilla planifolia]
MASFPTPNKPSNAFMASFLTPNKPTNALKPYDHLSSLPSVSSQRSCFLPFHPKTRIMQPTELSCRSGAEDNHDKPTDILSRRNLLIGLGSLYGGTTGKTFDENSKLVRAEASECPDFETRLGYKPRDVYNPWSSIRPARAETSGSQVEDPTFPVTLETSNVSLRLRRPPINQRTKGDEEIIFLQGIELDKTKFVKFDVYVNAPPEALRNAAVAECAGSFVSEPQLLRKGAGRTRRTNLRLAITDLLEDLKAAGDDSVVVTLVPRTGTAVKIGAISIELLS